MKAWRVLMEIKKMRRKPDNRKFTGRLAAYVLALAVLFFPAQPVLAADNVDAVREIPAVSYYGQAGRFVFTPGTAENPADLFDMFKGMMPGDVRVQEITLRNTAESRAPINLFLRAYVPAMEEDASETQRAEAEKARAFLEKLTVTVTPDEFSDRPMLDAGAYPEQGMGSWVFLGRFDYGASSVLRVRVSVPAELGDETYSDNDFQNMEAAVRWAFLVEEFNDAPNPSGPGENPVPGQPGNPTPDHTQNSQNPTPAEAQDTEENRTPDNAAQTVVPAESMQSDVTAVPGTPADPAVSEPEELEDIPTPLAPPADEEMGMPDEEIPLAAGTGLPAWALLNLILTVVTVLACAVLLLSGLKQQREEEEGAESVRRASAVRRSAAEEDGEERKRKTAVRLLSILPAAGSVTAFLLTEDMRAPMVFVDRWSWLMLLIALVQAVVCALACHRKKDEGDKIGTVGK